MTWNPGIPATGHSGAEDYIPMQQNFTEIYSAFKVNHVPLGTGPSGDGYHTQIQLSAPVTDPGIGGTVSSVYTKGSPTNLFFQSSSNNIVQMTNAALTASSGQGYMPGGLQIRTGFTTSDSPVSFTAFPTAIISVLLTSAGTPTAFFVTGSPSVSGFSFSPSTPEVGVYWLAIGY